MKMLLYLFVVSVSFVHNTFAVYEANCSSLLMGQYLCLPPDIDPKTQQPRSCQKNNLAKVLCKTADGIICKPGTGVNDTIFERDISCEYTNGYSYETALLLSLFLGMFGIDRFYLGYPAIGLAKLCTLGFMFLGQLVDIILIALQIKELLQEIEVTCSPSKLLQQQRLLLGHLFRSKELKQDHLMHELRLITLERDNLLEKVKLLEEELKNLKLSNEIWDTDNKHWETSLLNMLCQVIQQRDVAVKNGCSQNSDYFNFRSPGHEKSFDAEHINECLQRLDGASVKKKVLSSHSQNDIKKYPAFSLKSKAEETRFLKEEILSLNKSLEIEKEKREIAEDKCMRLERLVSVLQKKINGQNVGVPV